MTAPPTVPGMNDILPAEAAEWRALEDTFRHLCERHGFGEVRTPICEYLELFERGVGQTTDVVEKEMYALEDRGGRMLALRPENTAPAVRAYLAAKRGEHDPAVTRWYYLGPMFRGERPAKGRYRQFHQVGIEVYGDPGAAADAEVIALSNAFILALGIPQPRVCLNSLGSNATRARYRAALIEYFTPRASQLSADSQRRLAANPLRILDSKAPEDIAHKAGAPKLGDFLTDEERAHFDTVGTILTRLGVPFEVDPTVVRGLDYYTSTIFEFKDNSGGLGAQDTLGAGGRYDNLIAELGGKPSLATPAVGIALGIERLLLCAPARTDTRVPSAAVIAIAKGGAAAIQAEALAIARELRDAGIVTHVDTRFGKADRQFVHATRVGARAGVVIGEAELAAGTVNLKDLDAKSQQTIPRSDLVAQVRSLLATAPPSPGPAAGGGA
jgi:histidyl-tRNA synthetase